MPEVLVIGAGPVGLLLAAELSRRGIEVGICEQRTQPGFGSRAIGIHPPVLAALENSGLTAGLLDHALRVGRGQARSGGRLLGTVRFDQLSTRFPFIATLPQTATEQVLARAAPRPQRGLKVTRIQCGTGLSDHVQLRTETGDRSAPLVVLAGGAGSRSLVYQQSEAHAYTDRYLMTDTEVADDHDAGLAVVHLEPSGVLESFPLPQGRRRFVAWETRSANPDSQAQRSRLQRALAARGETITGEVAGFGVRKFLASRMRKGRVFVIGDAAHEVSPIGGQGMNLGLLDAATLAPLLAEWVQRGSPPEAALRRWEKARLRSARRAATLAGLNTRLGRPCRPPVNAVRRAGLRVMLAPGARRLFSHAYAMGFDAAA